jgi:aspartate aminotransferase
MISHKMQELISGSSLIRKMFEEGKRLSAIHGLENVYDFSLGNPNVEPPESVKEAIREILDTEAPNLVHGYMNNSGYDDVRMAIAAYTNQKNGTKVSKEHIVMTCGAAGGLNIMFKTLLNPDDEVLTFAPYFAEYNNYVSNFNAKLVVVPPDKETFQPNLGVLESYVTEKTKIVLINSPNNPSGVIYSEASIIALTNFLKKKEVEYGHAIYMISDEPYRELVYDGAFVPYLLNYYTNAIVGYSYSKSLSLPGERIGYLVIHPDIEDLENVLGALNVANRILGFVNAPSLFQRVVAKTLGAEVDVSEYKKNRDLLYRELTRIGFSTIKSEGTFYLFVKAPIEDDGQFCEDAKQFNVLLVPGKAFGCSGYVRLAYCISYERVVNSIPAFEKLWKLYQN